MLQTSRAMELSVANVILPIRTHHARYRQPAMHAIVMIAVNGEIGQYRFR
jgi:hypothetical protein